jgi:hypothetical protein
MAKTLKEITEHRPFDTRGFHLFVYSSWNEFISHTPWQMWRNMELCNYVWTSDNMLYIFFDCLKDSTDKRYFMMKIKESEDTLVREWLKVRIPVIWSI